MNKDRGNLIHLARELGISEQELLEPFQALQSMRIQSITSGLNNLSDEERKYAIWFMDRKDHEMELMRRENHISWLERSKYVLMFFSGLVRCWLGLPDRELPERDLDRPWNETYHAYDNEYYQSLEETKRLKEELFGHITNKNRDDVEHLFYMFRTEVMIIFTPHAMSRRVPKAWKNYPERMETLLRLWLSQSSHTEPEL